jgi:hypothetical protein
VENGRNQINKLEEVDASFMKRRLFPIRDWRLIIRRWR